MMTIEEAKQRIENIQQHAEFQDSDAHEAEDKFHRDVLKAIAESSDLGHIHELARLALSTSQLQFNRYFD